MSKLPGTGGGIKTTAGGNDSLPGSARLATAEEPRTNSDIQKEVEVEELKKLKEKDDKAIGDKLNKLSA